MAPIRIGPNGKIKEIKIGAKDSNGILVNKKIIKGYIGTSSGNKLFYTTEIIYYDLAIKGSFNDDIYFTINKAVDISALDYGEVNISTIEVDNYALTNSLIASTGYGILAGSTISFYSNGTPLKDYYSIATNRDDDELYIPDSDDNYEVSTCKVYGDLEITFNQEESPIEYPWTISVTYATDGSYVTFSSAYTPSATSYYLITDTKSYGPYSSIDQLENITFSNTEFTLASTSVYVRAYNNNNWQEDSNSISVAKNIITANYNSSTELVTVSASRGGSISYSYKKSGNSYIYSNPFNPWDNSSNYEMTTTKTEGSWIDIGTPDDTSMIILRDGEGQEPETYISCSGYFNEDFTKFTGARVSLSLMIVDRITQEKRDLIQNKYGATIFIESTGSSSYLKDNKTLSPSKTISTSTDTEISRRIVAKFTSSQFTVNFVISYPGGYQQYFSTTYSSLPLPEDQTSDVYEKPVVYTKDYDLPSDDYMKVEEGYPQIYFTSITGNGYTYYSAEDDGWSPWYTTTDYPDILITEY